MGIGIGRFYPGKMGFKPLCSMGMEKKMLKIKKMEMEFENWEVGFGKKVNWEMGLVTSFRILYIQT